MSLIIFLVITGICLVPFTAALFYFFIGIRSSLIGKKENNKAKTIGGYNSMAFSFLAIIAILFIWYVIVEDFLGINL